MSFVEFLRETYQLTVDAYFGLNPEERKAIQEEYENRGYKGVVF